jgi:hypothetical protein
MSGGQFALIIVGLVGIAESMWGISSPDKLKKAVEQVVREAPPRNMGMALFFAMLTAVFWVLMVPDRPISGWALLFMSWIFSGGAFVNLKSGGFQQMVEFLILRRSTGAIRTIYSAELLACGGMIGIALAGV